MLEYLHQHWCAYVSHGGLKEESFSSVKQSAADILKDLQNTVFPWNAEVKKDGETEEKNSKIDAGDQAFIERYKVWRAKKQKGEE